LISLTATFVSQTEKKSNIFISLLLFGEDSWKSVAFENQKQLILIFFPEQLQQFLAQVIQFSFAV